MFLETPLQALGEGGSKEVEQVKTVVDWEKPAIYPEQKSTEPPLKRANIQKRVRYVLGLRQCRCRYDEGPTLVYPPGRLCRPGACTVTGSCLSLRDDKTAIAAGPRGWWRQRL